MMTSGEQEYTPAAYFAETSAFFRALGAVVYTELTQDEIESLAHQGYLEQGRRMDEGEIAEGFIALGRYLVRRGMNARQDLAVEFARIFLGAGADEKLLATPFESVFTSPEGLLMQDARDECVRFYRQWGMEVNRDLNVPEDHLGFQLQFMAHLCDSANEKMQTGEDAQGVMQAQVDFLDNHVLNWIDALTERVEKCATLPFYPAIMKIIRGSAREHRAVIDEMLHSA